MRNIICIGASAGGVDALQKLVRGLPTDLRVSLFIVLHIPPYVPSKLAEILSSAGPLPARVPVHGERFAPGQIYVAPPDHHMMVEERTITLVRGPKENRFRPAIDPLFRSVAEHHPDRAVGVIMSGTLDDGKAGLWALKRAGGIAVVQAFDDCLFPDMPRNAAAETEVDHQSDAESMGTLFKKLSAPKKRKVSSKTHVPDVTRIENAYAAQVKLPRAEMDKIGDPCSLICPTCNGPLWKIKEGPRRFRCHIGHAFSTGSLIEEHRELTERTFSILLRLLDDEVNLLEHVRDSVGDDSRKTAELDLAEAESKRRANALRKLLAADSTPVVAASHGRRAAR